ncbi:hypothetical protein BGZ61DRAFT_168033 [Ilyonectria robusta]|uniref:uncharacterized protein n=1 Tax=Ilyonectria robusta TaxID=1079257 RepID=UPI001E8DE096|nr:uncharacterized protein BGZ61DRAFT_168033 [Ilyonectria robusta]KAH8733923.1 hypothetical protein BGZ61DRAFT_168033 [Ilyonectria robusta]
MCARVSVCVRCVCLSFANAPPHTHASRRPNHLRRRLHLAARPASRPLRQSPAARPPPASPYRLSDGILGRERQSRWEAKQQGAERRRRSCWPPSPSHQSSVTSREPLPAVTDPQLQLAPARVRPDRPSQGLGWLCLLCLLFKRFPSAIQSLHLPPSYLSCSVVRVIFSGVHAGLRNVPGPCLCPGRPSPASG